MLPKELLFNILLQAQEATAIFTGEDIIINTANRKMLELWGKDESVFGKPLEIGLPELSNQPFLGILKNVWKTGISYEAMGTEAELIIDGNLVKNFYDFELRAIKDENNNMLCIYNIATEVTSKLRDRQNLLAAESRINMLNADMHLANTELRDLSTSLDQSRQELSFAIDAAGLGFFDLDVKSERFRANATTKKWFNLRPEEDILLSDAIAAMVPEDQERVTKAINDSFDYRSGGEYEITYNVKNPGKDEYRTLYARGKVLFNDNREAVRFSGILQDVTEEEKDEKRKNDFIGMVSHELKTPLTVLNGALQMLQLLINSDDIAVKRSLHQKALNQVKKMTTMVNGFLTLGALDSGKIPLQYSIFEAGKLLDLVIEESQAFYTKHKFDLHHDCELKIYADEHKIYTILTNLISNAAKYSAPDSTIKISCSRQANNIIISVQDEGQGIPFDEVSKLFNRYYRVQNDSTNSTPGFGIGLYLCAEIINQHQGKIWAESVLGEGSIFYVSLPGLTEEETYG